MDVAVTTMLGVSDQLGRILVRPGLLHPPASLSRPQANSRATALRADGLGWEEHAADTPRFPGPAERLLFEAQRTNMVRNPRGEGAVADAHGTPGTLPANWSAGGPGLTRSIVGLGTEDGMPFIDVRISGTATSGHYTFTAESGFAHVSAGNGQTWTHSLFARLIAGPARATRCHLRQFNSTGGIAGDVVVTAPVFTTGRLAECRMTATGRLNQSATTRLQAFHQVNFTTGSVIDDTWRLGWSQLELGPFASTPILPPIGTPGTATRGADGVSASLAELGIGENGACTILWSGAFDVTNIASQQVIAAVDDGSNANRHMLRLGVSGIPEIIRVTANAGALASFGGAAVPPGTVVRAGCAIDGAGRLAGVVMGFGDETVRAVTGGPAGGLTTLRLGSGAQAIMPGWAQTFAFRVLPYPLPDAALPGAVAALPGG
ncbi:hypothetical protein [Falsiroseomonas sp.]|uniref:hypothetical protein n=1 Tax=Falsiroseomonas sp. TaxID=2870721 RepID=UPI0034A526D6